MLFSLRPSVLSPLFPAWDQLRRAGAHRDHLVAQLRAHQLLAELPISRASSEASLVRAARKRVTALDATAKQLTGVASNNALAAVTPTCPSRRLAVGWCAALEAEVARSDPAGLDFAAVQRGDASPWQHWGSHFERPYRQAPRLQPLESIYDKAQRSAAAAAAARSAAAALPGAGGASGAKGVGGSLSLPTDLAPRPGGPHIDLAGVTHAAGKRKSSTAQVGTRVGVGEGGGVAGGAGFMVVGCG